jgi:hypothetical protein
MAKKQKAEQNEAQPLLSAATSGTSRFDPDVSPDQLTAASHASVTAVFLQFTDGHKATIDLVDLGIDVSNLRLPTVRASSWGSAVEVEDATGKTVHIDSALLRAYSDPQYAKQLGEAIAATEATQE